VLTVDYDFAVCVFQDLGAEVGPRLLARGSRVRSNGCTGFEVGLGMRQVAEVVQVAVDWCVGYMAADAGSS
jgi:hypothetical protein